MLSSDSYLIVSFCETLISLRLRISEDSPKQIGMTFQTLKELEIFCVKVVSRRYGPSLKVLQC